MKTLGQRIRARRLKLGIATQVEFSKRTRIACCTLSLIETGKRKIGRKVARRIEKALKLREGALVR